MDFPIQMKTIRMGLPITYFSVPEVANSVGPDEMPHFAAFHLGLHCLPKYSTPLGVSSVQRAKLYDRDCRLPGVISIIPIVNETHNCAL